jgi:anti-sigma-K factor RskA
LVETKREPAPSRRNLWIGLGVAAGAVAVLAVVLGVALGATSDPTPTRGTISFGGL